MSRCNHALTKAVLDQLKTRDFVQLKEWTQPGKHHLAQRISLVGAVAGDLSILDDKHYISCRDEDTEKQAIFSNVVKLTDKVVAKDPLVTATTFTSEYKVMNSSGNEAKSYNVISLMD